MFWNFSDCFKDISTGAKKLHLYIEQDLNSFVLPEARDRVWNFDKSVLDLPTLILLSDELVRQTPTEQCFRSPYL